MKTQEITEEIKRWGLPLGSVLGLKERLLEYYDKYRVWTLTKTDDTSEYGFHYLSSLMRMETKRTMAGIARVSGVAVQNMQQFISDSPWSGPHLIGAIQNEIKVHPAYAEGSVLIIDESADEKSGDTSAGSGRQRNGRLGKVDMCQVGVFMSLTNNGYQTWINGELYVPEAWFLPENAEKYKRIGFPEGQEFQTKLDLALKLVKQACESGIPFDAVDCDSFYGRAGWFRDQLDQLGVEYYADIPENIQVYLKKPIVYLPETKDGKPAKNHKVVGSPYSVKEFSYLFCTKWETFTLRPSERGMLKADFARHRVWTVDPDGTLRQEWLLIRRDPSQITYSMSNAHPDTDLLTMAQRKSQRFYIERANQDAKSELGWDEFQAIKFRAWQHHLAFTILASWFITETQLEWAAEHPRDPLLLEEYEIDVLPKLSMANVRLLLRAVIPLPQLSPLEAIIRVIEHFDNRTRSRRSRLRKLSEP